MTKAVVRAGRSTRAVWLVVAVLLVSMFGAPFAAASQPAGTAARPANVAAAPTVAALAAVAAKAAAPIPTKVTAKVSAATINQRQAFTVSGTLVRSDTGKAMSPRTVLLYSRAKTTSTWSRVATARTDTAGRFAFRRTTQTLTMQYQVRYAVTATTRAASGPVLTVSVRTPLTSSSLTPAAGTAGLVGDTRTWSGTTSIRLANLKVSVQQLLSGSWRTIAAGTVAATGRFSVPFRTSQAGTAQYRLVLPAVTNVFVAGTSATVRVAVRALTIATTALPGGTVGTAYSRSIAVSNGKAPLTFSWSGSRPPGLSLSIGGLVSGTPTTAGAFTPTVKVIDANGQSVSRAFPLTIGAPAYPVITDTALPAAQVGVGYAYQVRTTGGTGAFSWTLDAGTLPAGLSLNQDTGLISGTPTATGSAAVTLRVQSAAGASTKQFTLAVGPARNWTQPEADESGSGYLPGENTITAGNIGQLRTEWTLPGAYATAVADGVVYWSGRLPDSSAHQGIAAYDGNTGNVLWTVPIYTDQYGTSGSCGELVVTASLVLCKATVSIVAVNRGGNHQVAWDTRITDEGFQPVTMVVAGDKVVATTIANNNGQVTVYQLTDGTRYWQRPLGSGTPYDVAAANGRVFVVDGSEDERMFVLNTGSVGWTKSGVKARQVLAVGDDVYAVEYPESGSQLVRRNATTGTEVWHYVSPYRIFGTATVAAGRIYLPTADFGEWGDWDNAGVLAVNAATGTKSWFTATAYPIRSGMAVQDGIVWVHASDLGRYRMPSDVLGVDSASGALLRTLTVSDTSFTAPIVGNGRLFIRHAYTIQVLGLAPPPVRIPAQVLPAAWTGTSYSVPLRVTGGTAPFTWSLAGGALPSGLALAPTGVISGTPGATGGSVTVRVTDRTGRTAEGTVSVPVRTAASTTWPMYGGGPGRTSLAASEAGIGTHSIALFAGRWSTQASTNPSGLPAGYDGATPAVTAQQVITIAQDGSLRAYSRSAAGIATPSWTVTIAPQSFVGSPTVVGDTVYVLTGEPAVAAYAVADGAARWAAPVPVGGGYVTSYGGTAPVVVGSRVVVQSGQAVTALQAATGAPSWTFALGNGTSGHTFGVSTDGTRVFVIERCEVVAITAATGAQAWRGRIPAVEDQCADNLTYLGMAAVTPVYADGVVYVGSGMSDVAAFDAATGGVRWRNRVDAAFAGPVVTETTVVFAGQETGLHVLDRQTGRLIQVMGTVQPTSTLVAVGDLLVYRALSGALEAVDVTDLSVQWTSSVLPVGSAWNSPFSRSPAVVAGGRLYAYANDGTVRAYGPPG